MALEEAMASMKSALEISDQKSCFYSRMFVVPKANGGWRPIMDHNSLLKKMIQVTKFKMKTPQQVLTAINPGDWVSMDLKDAYFQVPNDRERRSGHPVLEMDVDGLGSLVTVTAVKALYHCVLYPTESSYVAGRSIKVSVQ